MNFVLICTGVVTGVPYFWVIFLAPAHLHVCEIPAHVWLQAKQTKFAHSEVLRTSSFAAPAAPMARDNLNLAKKMIS